MDSLSGEIGGVSGEIGGVNGEAGGVSGEIGGRVVTPTICARKPLPGYDSAAAYPEKLGAPRPVGARAERSGETKPLRLESRHA